MKNVTTRLIGIVVATGAMLGLPTHGAQAQGGVELGVLTCETVPGTRFNLIIRSTVDVECTFKGTAGEEHYRGETGIALGVDLSLNREEIIAFTVISAASDISPGSYALTGRYVGGKASATAGIGAGVAVLVGGGDKSISLQPLALEGSTGLGVAGGIGYLYIEPAAR